MEDHLPHVLVLPRKDMNALLCLSHNASFRHLPPRNAKGMVLRSDVLALLRRSSVAGAPADEIPSELLSVQEACRVTSFPPRRLHEWVNRGKIPCYKINCKTILFREADIIASLGAKSRLKMPVSAAASRRAQASAKDISDQDHS